MQTLANFLPFKWTFGYPIESLVGDLSTRSLLLGLVVQALWIVIGLVLYQGRVAGCDQALHGGGWMNALRVAWLYLKIGVLNELQYRVNFFVQLLQSAIQIGTGLVMLSLVYSHTDELHGWTQPELLSLLGVQVLLGGVIHAFIQPNMERLMQDVQEGTLDYALTKPADSQVLVSVRMVRIWQVVEIVSGTILLFVGLTGVNESVGVLDALAFGFALVIGAVLVYCFWLIMTTGAFWIVRMEHVLELFEGIYRTGPMAGRRLSGVAAVQRHVPRARCVRGHRARAGSDVAAAVADAGPLVRLRLRVVCRRALVLAFRPEPLLRRVGLTRPVRRIAVVQEDRVAGRDHAAPAPWQTPESHISFTCTPAASSFAFASATSGTPRARSPGGSGVNS